MDKKRIKTQATIQILIIVAASFAFCYIINTSMVSADEPSQAMTATGISVVERSGEDVIKGYKIIKDIKITGEVDGVAQTIDVTAGSTIEKTVDGAIIKSGKQSINVDQGVLDKAIEDGGISTVKEKASSTLSELFGATKGQFLDAALTGVQWAAVYYGIGQLIGSFAGLEKDQTQAVSTALAAGSFTYNLVSKWGQLGFQKGLFAESGKGLLGLGGLGWGLIAAGITFAIMYKDTHTELVEFNCKPWQAPTGSIGGNDCEKCNEGILPCSEYRCKSLGQACELLNPGTEDEKCTWVNPRDTESPGIKPWEDSLTSGYEYDDVIIRPPGSGVEPGRMRIIRMAGTGCVEAFTPIEFGITTTEPAQCKIDYNHTESFDEMNFWFGESNLFLYNHSQKLSLPSPSSLEAAAPELEHDGTYTLYARCKDANDNENVDEFAIRFCVDEGPDTTPPKIESTSIANGMPVKYNQSSVELEVYVNEPAECRWSREDRSYNNMENEMSCSTNVWEMNNNLVYTCETTLTGIKNRQENEFYFRCKDQPNVNEEDRNTNQESYEYTLIGTQPLNIIDVSPNGTIKGSTDVISIFLEVETANGYRNGEAVCYYSETDNEADFIEFYETGTNMHSQRLDLVTGDYAYYLKCVDLGGNRDDNYTEFRVEVDRSAPIVARIYRESELLKIITTEKSDCRYSTQDCNFEFTDGIEMPYANQTEHVAEWQTELTYYIRCQDEYGNQVDPNSCSIIARPFEIIEQAED